MLIKSLWERLSREVDRKLCVPKNVVHISANVDPKDIRLDGANESKVKFIASGSKPLEHDSKMKLTEIMERSASKLHKFLPVILGLGIQSTIPRIKDDDLKVYDGILKIDRDEREGMCQVLIFYSLCLMA